MKETVKLEISIFLAYLVKRIPHLSTSRAVQIEGQGVGGRELLYFGLISDYNLTTCSLGCLPDSLFLVWLDNPFGVAPCCLRLLAMGLSKQTQLASGQWLLWSYSKGKKDWCRKVSVLHQSFPLDHSRSTSLAVWMAGGADREYSLPLKQPLKQPPIIRMAVPRVGALQGQGIRTLCSDPSVTIWPRPL